MTQALRQAPPLLLMVAVVASLLLFSTNTGRITEPKLTTGIFTGNGQQTQKHCFTGFVMTFGTRTEDYIQIQ